MPPVSVIVKDPPSFDLPDGYYGNACADKTIEVVFAKLPNNRVSVVGCDGAFTGGMKGAERLCGKEYEVCKSWQAAAKLGMRGCTGPDDNLYTNQNVPLKRYKNAMRTNVFYATYEGE